MKIGIDCRNFYDSHTNSGAGVERYVYHLVKKLVETDSLNDYVLFFKSDLSPETIHKIRSNNSRVKVVRFFDGGSKIPLYDSHLRFSLLLRKEKLDLTIFPANIIPLFYRRRSILVIHDLAIYLHPEWFPEKQWFATKILVPYSIRKARKIVAVSNNTKKDLMELFHVSEKKITVIYPGVVVKSSYLDEEKNTVNQKFDIKGEYILYLGTIEPRKNIANLIKAFSNYVFENEEESISLVLAGVKGWKFQPIFQSLTDINKRLDTSRIKYVGAVSNRERNILLKHSRAFIFPSLYEGFGFPVLEAMALGVPVVTGNNSSLQEIAADGAAILVNAEDPVEIRRAIKTVINDKYMRHQLTTIGTERAAQFTWEKTVEQFQKLF